MMTTRDDSYLTSQNELRQLVAIDPVQPVNHGQAAHHPPAVAHVFQFLRPAVQTTVMELPLTQPAAQTILVH